MLALFAAALVSLTSSTLFTVAGVDEPGGFAAIAAIPIALAIPLLSLAGAYHPDAAARPGSVGRHLVPIWTGALIFLWILVHGLKIAHTLDLRGLALFAVAGPGLLLLQRYACSRAARRALDIGQIRFRRVFTITESQDSGGEAGLFEQPDAASVCWLNPLDAGSRDRLIARIRASGAEEIRLVCRGRSLGECRELLDALRKVPLPVRLVADPIQAELLKCPITRSGGSFAFEIQRPPLNAAERALKRCFDCVMAVIIGFLLFPLLAFVAILIRFTSPGPVLFRQTRNGFNGHPFEIYKFRTMTVQEDGAAVVQARPGDSRITPLGRFLRRSSIDELPQLINVLKGEMSLIGPRPHAMIHDRDFSLQIADYAMRHHVKPGITGWAQVNGFRGETRTEEAIARRVEFDLRYIERWSFWLDLWIMVQTVRALIVAKNAY
nr:exopolysaccharide biosynthesis polyprenyl glycosylphosphotransferase [Methylobacterium sp. BTF04]